MTKRELIMQALCRASLCWSEAPVGIFDAEKALAICDKLNADLDRYDEKAQREYMANLALEVGDEP